MLILIVLASMFFVISAPTFVYWGIISLIRINNSRKYKRGAARHITDKESVYLCDQICYHYQTEIVKYFFLLGIIIAEFISGVSNYLQFLLESYASLIHRDISSRIKLEECAKWNNSILMDTSIDELGNSFLIVLNAMGNVADVFVVGFGVCLMNYLIGRMKHCDTSIMNIKRFILILSLICLLLIMSSILIFFSNLNKALFLSALTTYYIMFLLEAKRFKQALLQIAIERIAQHGPNEIEMRQYRYFSYSMNTVCIGFFLITLSVYIGFIMHLIISGLFFGDCYFPFYFFSGYEAIIPLSEKGVTEIVKVMGYIKTIRITIICIGVLFWVFPLVSVTFFIWIKFVYNKISGYSTVKFRYNVNSSFHIS